MIKVKANPLVIAAALGLLGPAALMDDEEDAGLGGMWQRSPTSSIDQQPARLASQIQLLPIDNRYVLDQGTASGPQGSWTTKPPITQIVREDGVSISRQFTMDGDDLTVRTVVDQDDQRVEYTDVYTRIT